MSGRIRERVTLIGFMGSGKTSVGRLLARILDLKQVDLDGVIEERERMSINEIFKTRGEAYFRDLERAAMAEMNLREEPVVLCSGGGIVLDPRNIDAIRERGVAVWLRAAPETIYARVCRDGSRPLLKDGMSVEKIASILEARLPLYEKAADLTVDTDDKTTKAIALEVMEALRRR